MVTAQGSSTPLYDKLPLPARILVEQCYCLEYLGYEARPMADDGDPKSYYKELRSSNNVRENQVRPVDLDALREGLAGTFPRWERDNAKLLMKTLTGMISKLTAAQENKSARPEQGPGQMGRG